MGISNLTSEARLDLVRNKAYELYVQRGCTQGRDMDDWLLAEKIVDREFQETKILPRPEAIRERPRAPVPPVRSGFKRVSG